MLKKAHKPVVKQPMNSRKYKVGDRVYGIRSPDAELGTIVEMYVTINNNRSGHYRNSAYVIRCDRDGKNRVYQAVKMKDIFESKPQYIGCYNIR